MAVLTYIETDTGTNVDISAATAVGAYTSTGDKLVMCDVSIDAVAGNGDYVMYVTRKIGGSGSAYRILPQTTMAAASGLTAISAQSGWITVRNGDVLTVYVDGLAGDTSTPDWTTRWFELAGVTAAAVADAVLDEATSGHTSAGSFSKAVTDILADTGTDGVVVASMAADSITAAALKADAVTEIVTGIWGADLSSYGSGEAGSDLLQYQYQTYLDLVNGGRLDLLIDSIITHLTDIKGAGWTDETLAAIKAAIDAIDVSALATAANLAALDAKVDTVDGIVDAIKAKTDNLPADPADDSDIDTAIAAVKTVVDAIKTETDGHPTAAEVWSHPTRTLTNQGIEATSPASGDPLIIYRDTTVYISLTGLGDTSTAEKIFFTAKENLEDLDSDSIIQIVNIVGTPDTDTLLYINKAAPSDATKSTFEFGTSDDHAAGTAVVTIDVDNAANLPIYAATPLYWDVKQIAATTGVSTILSTGSMYIYGTPTRTIT